MRTNKISNNYRAVDGFPFSLSNGVLVYDYSLCS